MLTDTALLHIALQEVRQGNYRKHTKSKYIILETFRKPLYGKFYIVLKHDVKNIEEFPIYLGNYCVILIVQFVDNTYNIVYYYKRISDDEYDKLMSIISDLAQKDIGEKNFTGIVQKIREILGLTSSPH